MDVASQHKLGLFRACFRFLSGAVLVLFGCIVLVADEPPAELTDTDPPLFQVRPSVRFLTPTSAEFRWESTVSGPAVLIYGPTRKLGHILTSDSNETFHRVVVENLEPGKDYWYRIGIRRGTKRSLSEIYQLEGGMNYTPPVIASKRSLRGVDQVVKQLPQRGGYAVVTEGIEPDWAEALAAQTTMTVIYATSDSATLQSLRRKWYEADRYGIRLTVQRPEMIPDSFANLAIVNDQSIGLSAKLLSPNGRIVKLDSSQKDAGFHWRDLSENVLFGEPEDKPTLAAWGHQYGSTANASYSGETLGGVDNTDSLQVKWLGKPGADFGIDRNPRMPAPLAVGGRLFHQGMNRMIALDAFNGAVLWSLEIPDLRRVNIPRDSANWCADETHVYAAVKDLLWVIDAASGEVKRTMVLPENNQHGFDWGYVGVTESHVIGTAVKQGSSYSTFWDRAAWYDGKDDAATAKVCGNVIVGYDKDYGSIEWEHQADAIVHSTITVQGDRVYFVQVDDPSLKEEPTGKLINAKIWHAASIVCLDMNTGKQLWKSKVPPQEHEAIISFGIADENQFVLQTSGKNQFHFVSLDAESGESRWNRSVDWPEDHHGAHVQHAVLMNGQLLVQPHILDAEDGSVVKSGTLGKRRGCATPIGAGNSIIYRGGSGPVTLWSLDKDTTSEFARLRPSCWLSTIPAQGMLFSPEGGGGCSCGGWMETSIGFAPVVALGENK